MPLAVTHVLSTIILVDLFRDYIMKLHKRWLTLHTILIAGISGLLPDIDIPINWVLHSFGYSFEIMKHGGLTHTAFFGIIFLIPAILCLMKKKHKIAMYFFRDFSRNFVSPLFRLLVRRWQKRRNNVVLAVISAGL